jgi:putative salt-induced outer membrane protein YdiY
MTAGLSLCASFAFANAQDGLPAGDGGTSEANLDLMTGRDSVVTLDSGEVFRGRLLGHGGGMVALRNAFAGEFEVPIDRVRKVEAWVPPPVNPVPVVNPLATSPVEAAMPQIAESGVLPVQPAEKAAEAKPAAGGGAPVVTEKGIWAKSEYSFEGGLSGSSGQTDRSNLRFGFAGRWSNPDDVLTFDARYLYTRQRERTVQDRFEAKARNEWISLESPWQVFAEASSEFDRFTRYDALLRGGAGVGYRFIKNDRTSLVGRVGVGFVREFGSDDQDVRPEGILGVDFSHKFDNAQSFVLNAEAFPSLEDFERIRTRTRAYYEVRLSEKTNLNLRLGVEHRFDNGPGQGDRENLDYAATFVIRF